MYKDESNDFRREVLSKILSSEDEYFIWSSKTLLFELNKLLHSQNLVILNGKAFGHFLRINRVYRVFRNHDGESLNYIFIKRQDLSGKTKVIKK